MEDILAQFPGVARTPGEIKAEWHEFVARRSQEGRIVGRGIILELPVSLDVEEAGEGYIVSLRSASGASHSFAADALARSKYRKQVVFVKQSGRRLLLTGIAYMSPLHVKLLEGVPRGDCISKAEFDALTARIRKRGASSQSDGPRRWRELKNEYGFNVWTEEGGKYCRGPEEAPVREPQVRPDTSKLAHDMLPKLVSGTDTLSCSKCGALLSFEKLGYVAKGAEAPGVVDHRRPVVYGGTDALENLQLLCVRCNNLKRTYCERCPLGYQCERCSWAYPERVADHLVIHLSVPEAEKFEKILKKYDEKPARVAKQLLLEAIERHLP